MGIFFHLDCLLLRRGKKMSDKYLIIASKLGDSRAFKKLVKRYQKRVSNTEIKGLYRHHHKLETVQHFEKYLKSGSGHAFANRHFWEK